MIQSSIAYALPLKNIEIDGDLSDWPDTFEKYAITDTRKKQDSLSPEKSAYFKVGYDENENHLLVAISYPNDSTPIIDEELEWNKQDSYSFYIDEQHMPFGSGVARYSFNEKITQARDPKISWDPKLLSLFDWDKLEKGSKKGIHRTTIELKYELTKPLEVGMAIGMNHTIVDANNTDVFAKFYTWIGSQYGDYTAGRLGTVVVAASKPKLTTLTGSLKWNNNADTIATFPQTIVVKSKTEPTLWATSAVDSLGAFKVRLPHGSYELTMVNDLINMPENYLKYKFDPTTNTVDLDKDMLEHSATIKAAPFKDLLPKTGILNDGLSEGDKVKIDEFIAYYMQYYGIPGVQIAVITNGEVSYSKAFGYANTYTKEPLEINTLMEGASMTKPMFAFAVMRLVEKGIVDLDRPLYKDATPPKDIANNPWAKLITPRMVLYHKTGLPNWAEDTPDGKLFFKFKPGTGIGYSGTAFTFLRRAVEGMTNKSITEIMNEEVIKPLGLQNTYFKDTKEGLAQRTANGHYFKQARIKDIPQDPEMASSVHTNAEAYANFLLAIHRKEGLSRKTYDVMVHPTVRRDEHNEQKNVSKHYYGLGWSLQNSPFFGLSYGHSGSNGDFKCTSIIYEKSNNGFVVMTNGYTGHMLQFHLHNLLNIGTVQVDP